MDNDRIERIVRKLFAALLTVALAGCAITLVPAYDAQIDDGLTSLYTDTILFVDRMTPLAGTPAGEYAPNKGFYENAEARVDTLIVRAEANRVLKSCPTVKVAQRALDAARIPADVRGSIGNLPADDCEVVLLRLIRGGFVDMGKLHEAQGTRGLPASMRPALIDGGIGAQLRAGMTVEIAKRAK